MTKLENFKIGDIILYRDLIDSTVIWIDICISLTTSHGIEYYECITVYDIFEAEMFSTRHIQMRYLQKCNYKVEIL